jgi:hypothetical protein
MTQIADDRSSTAPADTHVEITRRLMGSSAIVLQESGARDISVRLDLESLVRRLLLFDTYILYSARLKEIPEMVRHFGYEGTLALLSSGAIEIRCDCTQFCEGEFGTPPCSPLTFQFHVIRPPVRDQYVIDNLAEVNRTPGLNPRELMNLQTAVIHAVRQPDYKELFRTSTAPSFESDVLHNLQFAKSSTRHVLEKHKGVSFSEDFDLRFRKVGDDRYRAETNLAAGLHLSTEEIHNTLKTTLLGMAGVNQCIGEMKAHNALSGFTDEEMPLFRTKLDILADAYASKNQERRFQRLVILEALPNISADSRIDIEKLLRIRDEPEALEFRSWLTNLDRYSDAEIRERLTSLNSKLGIAAQSTVGKSIRLLVTTVAGLYPPVGIPLSVLDQFLWDKFARRSGVAAFAHELYPSVFRT